MRVLFSILAVFFLLSCTLGGDETVETFEVYVSGVDGGVVMLAVEDGEVVDERPLGLKSTGELVESRTEVLVPSKSSVVSISNGSTEVVAEVGCDVKKVVYFRDGVVALCEDGISIEGEKIDGSFKDLATTGEFLYALSDGGIDIIEEGGARLLVEGEFDLIEIESPYMYVASGDEVFVFLIDGNGDLTLDSTHSVDFTVETLYPYGARLVVGGDGGIVLIGIEKSVVSEDPVSDVAIRGDTIFYVSDMENEFGMVDVSDPENPKSVLRKSLDLRNPSIALEGE